MQQKAILTEDIFGTKAIVKFVEAIKFRLRGSKRTVDQRTPSHPAATIAPRLAKSITVGPTEDATFAI